MDAHDRKRHISTIMGMSGSRVYVFVVTGRCYVRSRYRSVSVFQSWTCVDVVVVIYWLRRVWYVVGGPCWSPLPFIVFALS